MSSNEKSLLATYYPSCIVNMRVRFDETLTASDDTFQKHSVNSLLNTPSKNTPYVGAPKLVEYGAGQNYSQLFARIPKRAHVDLPAYRTAGKWSLTFDYNDLPIDPRTVRSLGVTIYMDAVPAADFADSMGATTSAALKVQGAIQPRTRRLSALTPRFENCIIQGVADTWQVEHGSGGSWVTIEGRDLRGCLLDSPITTNLLTTLDLNKNIVEVIREIVGKHPYGEQIKVAGAPAPEWANNAIPKPYADDNASSVVTRVNKGANGQKKTGATVNAQPEVLNFWDIICNYCNLVGAVPYFQAEQLIIKPARNLYAQQYSGNVRRFLFGRNIESMNVERKMGGKTPQQIEVVSLDTSSAARGTQKLRVARWPTDEALIKSAPLPSTDKQKQLAAARQMVTAAKMDPALVSGVTPTNSAGKQDVMVISYPGIKDIKRLQQLAQEIYEEIGRGELGGNIKTRNLSSFGNGPSNETPDLVLLRPGDAIQIEIDRRAMGATAMLNPTNPLGVAGAPLSAQAGMSSGELVAYLTKRLGDENLARVIVASSRNSIAELQNFYRVSNVVFDWDADSGISLAFDFHNYIGARAGVTPVPTTQGGSTPKPTVAPVNVTPKGLP